MQIILLRFGKTSNWMLVNVISNINDKNSILYTVLQKEIREIVARIEILQISKTIPQDRNIPNISRCYFCLCVKLHIKYKSHS